jgi:hypothetical protein
MTICWTMLESHEKKRFGKPACRSGDPELKRKQEDQPVSPQFIRISRAGHRKHTLRPSFYYHVGACEQPKPYEPAVKIIKMMLHLSLR